LNPLLEVGDLTGDLMGEGGDLMGEGVDLMGGRGALFWSEPGEDEGTEPGEDEGTEPGEDEGD
jgi:hypothetical protein